MAWWRTVALVTLGAVLGANLRYWISDWLGRHYATFPYGTLLVNTSGSLLLGFFLVWTSDRVLVSPDLRLLVAVGFCSSYTTFSSYSFETFRMIEQGQLWAAGSNFLANNLVCLACVLLGAALARAL
ncbi:MAG TPA: fluoride efflux transporter CrcB [Candidatus Xenobia bacterium]|nr:fluoride efflux transporter CrcB [Candidatus Xenobia bacterium]